MRRNQKTEEKPSPEEIREACQQIQTRWSESERLRRSYEKPRPWIVPRFEGEMLEQEPPQVA
jgi:hypothetical protein